MKKEKKARHIAAEQQLFDEIVKALPGKKKWAEQVFSRLKRVAIVPNNARVLDVGAASGGFLAAGYQLGYNCSGVEPWEEARLNATKLSEYLNIPIHILNGTAESIPFDNDSFDVVHASSVIEHVQDVERVFKEINRVLKPGGVFWFNAASSMCPSQDEIRGFPLFGWYPDSLKIRIMNWAKNNRPDLIGYTQTPAIHWFTPSKARKLLEEYGFKQVIDRWDLRLENEGGIAQKIAIWIIRSNKFTKTIADIIVSGCSYAAIK
jgi:ubiquinone/menaquinone biosynthesis C-methylase UbiE